MTADSPIPLVIMAAGHGTRSGLPAHQHKMLQTIGGRTILGGILEAAVDSPAVGEIIVDMNENNREAAREASALLYGVGRIEFSSPHGYLADFAKWGEELSGDAFIVDSDVYTPVEELRHFFNFGYSRLPDAPALAHTLANDSNRNDPRSAWVAVDTDMTLLAHARGTADATPRCTIGLWRTSRHFTSFLTEAHSRGLTSITSGVDNYLGTGQRILSPLVDKAVNVNSPEDLRVAQSIAAESLVP